MVVLTEWEDFRNINLAEVKKIMAQAKIIDLRNMLNAENAKANGFEYQCIGAKCSA